MKTWKECESEIHQVQQDTEMAAALLVMMGIRQRAAESLDREKFSSIIVEGYYEVIKEAITALMAIDGRKTLSHEALVAYLAEFYKECSEYEIRLIDQLRQLRNKIVYRGFIVRKDYLERNEKEIQRILIKLRQIIENKLK